MRTVARIFTSYFGNDPYITSDTASAHFSSTLECNLSIAGLTKVFQVLPDTKIKGLHVDGS